MHRKERNSISWWPFEEQLSERLHQKFVQLAKTGIGHTEAQEVWAYANYYLARQTVELAFNQINQQRGGIKKDCSW